MKEKLIGWGISQGKIICLDIEDKYKKLDSDLVRILENRLKAKIAFDSVGIAMLDHVIYTENGYFSFADDGILNGIQNTKTMITVENIISEYSSIAQNILPKALQESEFEFIQENIDLYNEDETIKQYIDTFVEKLNEVLIK